MHTNINNVEKQILEVVCVRTAQSQVAQMTLNCLNFQQYEEVCQYLRTATLPSFDRMFL